MKDVICIYHDPCADGFTSAWAVHHALSGRVRLHPASHGQIPPDVKDKHVVIVDYCYPKQVLTSMAKDAASILVLDHHISAEKELTGIEPPVTTASVANWNNHLDDITTSHLNNIRALFDMNRSGAGLTYDFFSPEKPRPLLINYIEDRDLWRFSLPESRAISEFIFTYSHRLEDWDALSAMLEERFDECAFIGNILIKKKTKDIDDILDLCATTETIAGYDHIPVVNVPNIMGSDAAHALSSRYPDAPFTAYYYDLPAGIRKYGLRSPKTGADVSEIAVSMGGGGHKHAAGFTVKR